MTLTPRLLFWIAALLCMVIALLLALGAFTGNYVPWMLGGFVAWLLAVLWPVPGPP